MKSGYMLGNLTSGPWVTASGIKGMHGFLPGDPMLEASFVAYGPGIRAKHLGQHKLVDVAPTVSKLLGLQAQGMRGEDLLR